MVRAMWKRFKSAFGDTAGSLSITVAATAAIVIIAGGIALDVVKAMNARAKLQAAADSAALAAANLTTDSTAARNDGARKASALAAFDMNAADLATASISAPGVVIKRANGGLTAKVTFAAKIQTTFARLIGMESIDIEGDSVAASGAPPYVDIIAIIDNSMSMGIGQTRADQDKMLADNGVLGSTVTKLNGPCAVACHALNEDTYSYYRNRGVTLRIDVVRGALLKVVQDLGKDTARASRTRIAVATLEESYGPSPFAFTRDFRAVAEKVRGVELAKVNGMTNLSRAFRAARLAMRKSGDGSAPDKAMVVVLLLSDGFEHFERGDSYKIYSTDRATDPRFPAQQVMQNMSQKECDLLKAKGARIMMLNTGYEIPVKAWNWNTGEVVAWNKIPLKGDVDRIRVLLDKIPRTGANMKACASAPDYFQTASSPERIELALKALVNFAYAKKPHLSE
jgi:Flp pilus assembly protein TadG